MKLSEVIKAIEDGSKNKFVNTIYSCKKSQRYEGVYFEVLTVIPENTIPINGWEEIKPPRQWSEKELMLFKLLRDWAKWIAKNSIGNIFAYDSEPRIVTNDRSIYRVGFSNYPGKYVRLEFDFLTITFEESPVYIGDLKGE